MDESLEIIGWLKGELKSKLEAQVLLNRIEENFKICIPVLTAMEAQRDSLEQDGEKEKWKAKRRSILPNLDTLQKDMTALIAIVAQLENEGPERERVIREQTQNVLVIGFSITFLLVLIVGYLFTSRVTARLAVINDNIGRLKEGIELEPQLSGSDEIALVDAHAGTYLPASLSLC